MENIMSKEEKNKVIGMYSSKLCRSSGSLGKYYAEIVDSMTYEDAQKLLELGIKYEFDIKGNNFIDAFKVVLSYVSMYHSLFNTFCFKKTPSDFENYYSFLCAKAEYYGNLIEELKDENSINSIIAISISQCILEQYPEFDNMQLLANLNNYLVENANTLLKCKCEYLYNNVSYTKSKALSKKYKQWEVFGNQVRNCNFDGDNS